LVARAEATFCFSKAGTDRFSGFGMGTSGQFAAVGWETVTEFVTSNLSIEALKSRAVSNLGASTLGTCNRRSFRRSASRDDATVATMTTTAIPTKSNLRITANYGLHLLIVLSRWTAWADPI
jgi:hypothetical protein